MRDEPLMLAWDLNGFFPIEQELFLDQNSGCLYLDIDGQIQVTIRNVEGKIDTLNTVFFRDISST